MIIGVDIKQRFPFVSSADKTEPQTVFIFRPLSGAEMIRLSPSLDSGDFGKYLDATIAEITGMPEGAGTKAEYIETLPARVLSELIVEANRINRLTEQDAKN